MPERPIIRKLLKADGQKQRLHDRCILNPELPRLRSAECLTSSAPNGGYSQTRSSEQVVTWAEGKGQCAADRGPTAPRASGQRILGSTLRDRSCVEHARDVRLVLRLGEPLQSCNLHGIEIACRFGNQDRDFNLVGLHIDDVRHGT